MINDSQSKLFAYLKGEMSNEESLEMQDWIASHADDPQVLDALYSYFESLCEKPSQSRVKRITTLALRAAAVIALPLCFLLGRNTIKQEDQLLAEDVVWNEKFVPAGETSSLTLSDGTVLSLNSGSRVTYPSSFSGDERKIFLDGQVVAEVARDPEHPFIVSSGNVDVRVYGTKFDFKSFRNSDRVELLLMNGSVSMNISEDGLVREVKMTPGDVVQYDRLKGDVSISTVSPDNYRPFTEGGAIHFFDLTLSDIAKDLERLFGVNIVISDERTANLRYFALFSNNEDLNGILSALNADGTLRIRHNGDTIYISHK